MIENERGFIHIVDLNEMDASIQWEKSRRNDSSLHATLRLGGQNETIPDDLSLSDEHRIANGNTLDNFCVEGICTANYFITATYDLRPLTSLTVSVRKPTGFETLSDSSPRARKLLYKPKYGEVCTFHYRESLFTHASTALYETTSISFALEERCCGVLFLIELDDGSNITPAYGNNFCIGLGKRNSLCTLEIPFPWPLERSVRAERVLSLHRSNLFWLQPQLDNESLNNLLHETSFVLMKLDRSGESLDQNQFACIVVAGSSTSTQRVTMFSTGTFPALRIESVCLDLPLVDDINGMVVAHCALGTDPFSAVRAAFESLSRMAPACSSRSYKLSSAKWDPLNEKATVLNHLGFCTWDALGHKCDEESVLAALKWFASKGVQIRYLVVDDGWQDGGSSGPLSADDPADEPSPKLVSFSANDKFPYSLTPLSKAEKLVVYVWMTVIGYWGGADGSCLQRDTIRVSVVPSTGLNRNIPEQTKMWEREYEILAPSTGNVESFFRNYFSELFTKGVRGVKIDGQSILGSFSTYHGGQPGLTAHYRDAIRRAAEHVFPDEVILNSMACAPEIILNSGDELSIANICWRTSDDHAFPDVKETEEMVAWHVLRNAMNSLFLGEIFPVTDWDMFCVGHENAYIHAVARVLSGGPVYISDSVPLNERSEGFAIDLIRKLTTSDGRILRCADPGRPTRGCVFGDPRCGKMFKVFNRNTASGVVGLFNLSTKESGDKIRDAYCSADVEDFRLGPEAEFISVVIGSYWRCAFKHTDRYGSQEITLWPMEAAIAHIYPVLRFGEGLKFAAVGRLDMLNCGGVVKCVCFWNMDDQNGYMAEVFLADSGTICVWLGENACSRLKNVIACGEPQEIAFMQIDGLSFLSVNVPKPRTEQQISLQMTFASEKSGC